MPDIRLSYHRRALAVGDMGVWVRPGTGLKNHD